MNASEQPLSRWKFFWPTLVVVLCCAAALVGMARFARGQARAVAQAEVREQLARLRSSLSSVAEASFTASASLENLVRVQGTLSDSAFRLTVEGMLSGQHQLRNVAVAPQDVVAHVHPLAGNERALGLDYRSVQAQWAQVERARLLRAPLIFAPVKLVQGGQGVVQRRPVFLREANGDVRYWGVISTVADLDRFVSRAGLPEASLELALVERRIDERPGQLIWGRAELAQQEHLSEDLVLPGANWSLIGRPKGGWELPWWQSPWLVGSALTALILMGLSGLLAHRRWLLALRQRALEVEISARQLSQQEAEQARSRLEALLATASDWYWEQDASLRLCFLASNESSNSTAHLLARQIGKRRWEQDFLVPGLPDEASWDAHRRELDRHQPVRDFRYALQRPGEALRWVSISGDPVFDTQGHFAGYRGTGRDITAMQELDAALSRSRERLQAVLAAATQVAIIATDLDDRITDFNAGAEQLLGYPAAVVIGSSPQRFHDPAEVAARAQALSRELGRSVTPNEVFSLRQGEPQVWTLVRRDGSRVTVSLVINELRDGSGRLLGRLGLALDLSAELSAQKALVSTAQRLQAVLDSAEGVAIVTCGLDGRVEIFNRGAELILGCRAADAIGTPAVRFHLREELEREAQALSTRLGIPPLRWNEMFVRQAQGLDGGHTRLWTYVRADDGRHRTVSHSFSELHEPDGRLSGYLAIARDVSEQVQAQQALRETRDRLQAVLDAAQDIGILVVDMRGHVQLFNRGAEKLFGYRAEEIIDRSSLLLHDGDELAARAHELSLKLGRPIHRHEVFMLPLDQGGGSSFSHWTYVRKDGGKVPGALRLRRMQAQNGVVEGFLAIAIDISAEVHAQQQLERLNQELEGRVQARTEQLALAQDELLRSERLAALGSMVAGVAHELNTPLGTAMTAASTLKDRTQELLRDVQANQLKRSTLEAYARDSHAMAELLMRSLVNASDLVAHFKQLSVDQTSDNRRRFALQAVIDDVLTVLRPQLKGGRLQVQTAIELSTPIDAYPGELGRLLTNLILNAQLHAFEPGSDGRLTISARELTGQRYELVVADNGRGMSEDVRRRAFDPFFTTKLGQGGSGLGLNIVWNIATGVLGGLVRLESAPGQGTRFVFELPLVAPQRSSSDEGSDLKPTSTAPGAGAAEHGQPGAGGV